MTAEGIEALPDVTAKLCALYQKEDDGVVKDAAGVWWLTGWLNGERVKRRFDGP